ncbi:MAG: hypothetical protein KJ880_00295 [Candidatus Omnitrophica bacterium]|nr:hypothetical protein [Candidatus Omnitrophota bacterium]MBU1870458.1 hypothetical protein [Candidatus Omnitrophota bacterium]
MEKQRKKSFDRLLEEEVLGMERVLFRSDTALTALTRYCLSPDKELEAFAKLALEECLIWNK